MVSALGGLPLANPLMNPVLGGAGQFYNALYAPMTALAQPMNSLAYAMILDPAKAAEYGAIANAKNAQAAQANANVAARVPQATAAQKNASAGFLQARTEAVPYQIAVDQARIPLMAAQSARQGQEAVNLGAPLTVNPGTVTPGMDMMPQQPMMGGNSNVPMTNNPGAVTPQQLQQQLSGAYQQQFGGQPQGFAQSQQQAYPSAPINEWAPDQQMQYLKTQDKVPPLPMGTPINPKIDATTLTKINAMPQIANQLVQLHQLYNDPDVAPYIGKNASNYISSAQAQLARGGQVPAGYQKYQAAMQLSNMVTDGIARTMAGSRAATIMMQFNKAFNGGDSYGLGQFNQVVSQAAQDAYKSALGYAGTNYIPGIRQTAFEGAKSLASSGLLPQEESSAPPAQAAPSQAMSSMVQGVPEAFVQQYMQQKGWGK